MLKFKNTSLFQTICDLPTLSLKLTIRGLWFDSDSEQDKRVQQPQSKDSWIPLHADQVSYTICYLLLT